MPSPLGHAMAGVAIAWSAESFSDDLAARARASNVLALTCGVLAALPDIDLVYPPAHRGATHSVGAVILVTSIAIGVTGWVTHRIDWRVVCVCAAAYASHIVLDWLAYDPNPPFGIQALWPFSHRWFISGLNVFRATERRQLFTWAAMLVNVEAVAQEIAILGPVLLAAYWSTGRSGTTGRAGGRGGIDGTG